MTKPNQFKRKFKVPGNTPMTCKELCKKELGEGKPSCNPPTSQYGRMYNNYYPNHDKCTKAEQYGQPKTYVVSETLEGKWVCNCPSNIFRKEICDHIIKAQNDPKKYEIAVFVTASILKVVDAL
jgi:hypothetical protein